MTVRSTVTAGVLVAATAAGVPAVWAWTPEPARYSFVDQHREQSVHGDGWCGGVPFPVGYDVRGRGALDVSARGDRVTYRPDGFHVQVRYTNQDTGATLTVVATGNDGDQTVRDAGDGTLLVGFSSVGYAFLIGPGGPTYLDSGRIEGELVVATPGPAAYQGGVRWAQVLDMTADVGGVAADGEFCAELVRRLG